MNEGRQQIFHILLPAFRTFVNIQKMFMILEKEDIS